MNKKKKIRKNLFKRCHQKRLTGYIYIELQGIFIFIFTLRHVSSPLNINRTSTLGNRIF
jgi:hypothetical protein